MNIVLLVGKIVADSELKSTRGGDGSMYAFTLETPDKQQHRCVLWDEYARRMHALLKVGVYVTASGALHTHSWMHGDERRWMTQVRVGEVALHSRVPRRAEPPSGHWADLGDPTTAFLHKDVTGRGDWNGIDDEHVHRIDRPRARGDFIDWHNDPRYYDAEDYDYDDPMTYFRPIN